MIRGYVSYKVKPRWERVDLAVKPHLTCMIYGDFSCLTNPGKIDRKQCYWRWKEGHWAEFQSYVAELAPVAEHLSINNLLLCNFKSLKKFSLGPIQVTIMGKGRGYKKKKYSSQPLEGLKDIFGFNFKFEFKQTSLWEPLGTDRATSSGHEYLRL